MAFCELLIADFTPLRGLTIPQSETKRGLNHVHWITPTADRASFAHDGICKHVLAVTHLIEADKPEDERNNNVNLNRIMAQLNCE